MAFLLDLPFVTFIVLLTGFLIGTFTDFRTREVPDWLNYSLIALGLLFALQQTLINNTWIPILSSLIGLGVGVIIGFAMYYAGQWGGGDAKLIMGVGALIGLWPVGINLFALPSLILFLLNLVLAGAIYGIIWALVVFLKHKTAVLTVFASKYKDNKVRRVRYAMYAAVALLLLGALITQLTPLKISLFSFSLLSFALFYLWVLTSSIEKACMIKQLPVSKLTEGDWIVEDVIVKGEVLARSKDLGITAQQIAALKKHCVKSVVVKEGLPFVPSFLLAFLITIFFENWLLFFL